MSDLAGKAVLITGASKGIGRAAALAFAEAGSNVLAMARSEAPLAALCGEAEKLPGSCEYFAGDVANVEDIERAIDFMKQNAIENGTRDEHNQHQDQPQQSLCLWQRTALQGLLRRAECAPLEFPCHGPHPGIPA